MNNILFGNQGISRKPKPINVHFHGLWPDRYPWKDQEGNPINYAVPGVYCIYRCMYKGNELMPIEILYIGESISIAHRLSNHNRRRDWNQCLQMNESIWIGFASTNERMDIESALISTIKPRLNEQGKTDKKSIVLHISGCHPLIPTVIEQT